MTLGLVIGCFALAQTSPASLSASKIDAQEQTEDSPETAQKLSISEAVQSSPSQINLDFQSVLLEELEYEEDCEHKNALFTLVAGNSKKALKILFSRIISPNAP